MPWLVRDAGGLIWYFNNEPKPIACGCFPGESIYMDKNCCGYPVQTPLSFDVGYVPVEVHFYRIRKE